MWPFNSRTKSQEERIKDIQDGVRTNILTAIFEEAIFGTKRRKR